MWPPLGTLERVRGTWPGAATPEQAWGHPAAHQAWGHEAVCVSMWTPMGTPGQGVGHLARHGGTWPDVGTPGQLWGHLVSCGDTRPGTGTPIMGTGCSAGRGHLSQPHGSVSQSHLKVTVQMTEGGDRNASGWGGQSPGAGPTTALQRVLGWRSCRSKAGLDGDTGVLWGTEGQGTLRARGPGVAPCPPLCVRISGLWLPGQTLPPSP